MQSNYTDFYVTYIFNLDLLVKKFRFAKPSKLIFEYAFQQKLSTLGLPGNVLTDSDYYTQIMLLQLPSPGSAIEFEASEELVSSKTLFEQLLEAESLQEKSIHIF